MVSAGLEREVWECAARSYGQILPGIIQDALRSYARPPGYGDMTRFYRAGLCDGAFKALQTCLRDDWGNADPEASYLWVRQHKREHLYHRVLQRLVNDQLATGPMRDSLFSLDLGV